MSYTIVESGLTFGPFLESECFPIENSTLYKNIGNGVKMVEFVLSRPNTLKEPVLWMVEAKHSSPHPGNVQDFSDFIHEIKEKMVNALSLCFAAILKRHSVDKGIVPASMQSIDLSVCKVRCILVLNGHPEAWLPPIRDALRASLSPTNKTWNFDPNSVVVLNEDLAARYTLLQAT